jgi:uncharacterized protein
MPNAKDGIPVSTQLTPTSSAALDNPTIPTIGDDIAVAVRDEQTIRLLLLQMVRAVVNTPDQVRVEETEEQEATKYLVYVAPTDIGYAIGKEGRVANAIRTVVKEAAKRSGLRIYLDVKSYSEEPPA